MRLELTSEGLLVELTNNYTTLETHLLELKLSRYENSLHYIYIYSDITYINSKYWCPRSVMVKAMYYGIVIGEFELQSFYYVHFRTNTLDKGR